MMIYDENIDPLLFTPNNLQFDMYPKISQTELPLL